VERLSLGSPQHRARHGALSQIRIVSTKLNDSAPNEPIQNSRADWKEKQKERKKHMPRSRHPQIGHIPSRYQEEKASCLGRSTTSKDASADDSPRKHEPLFVPVTQSMPKAGSFAQRRMDKRLNGADLYVVRVEESYHGERCHAGLEARGRSMLKLFRHVSWGLPPP
jgi:hypothetical protein